MASAFHKLLSALPDSAPRIIEVARELTRRGELEHAVTLLRAANARHETTTFKKLLGSLLINQDKHDEALTFLTEALRDEAEDTTLMLLIAECLIERGDESRARAMLRQAKQLGASGERYETLKERLVGGFTLVPELEEISKPSASNGLVSALPDPALSEPQGNASIFGKHAPGLESPMGDSGFVEAGISDIKIGPNTFVDGPNTWFGEDPPAHESGDADRDEALVHDLFVTEAKDDAPNFWFNKPTGALPAVDTEASTKAYSVAALAARASLERMSRAEEDEPTSAPAAPARPTPPAIPAAPTAANPAPSTRNPHPPSSDNVGRIDGNDLARLKAKLARVAASAEGGEGGDDGDNPPSMELMDSMDMMQLQSQYMSGGDDHNINTGNIELEGDVSPGGFAALGTARRGPRPDEDVREFRKRNTAAIRLEDLPTSNDLPVIQPNVANERAKKRRKIVGAMATVVVLGLAIVGAGVLARDQQTLTAIKTSMDAATSAEREDTFAALKRQREALQKAADTPEPPVPISSGSVRGAALAALAAVSAELEWRFTGDDQFKSKALIERAAALTPGDPMLAVARVYDALNHKPADANSQVEAALKTHSSNPEVLRAAAAVALHFEDLTEATKHTTALTASPIAKTPAAQLLIARAKLLKEPGASADTLRGWFAGLEKHPSSQLALGRALIRYDAQDAERLLKPLSDHEAKLMQARALHARGELAVARTDMAGAEALHKQAAGTIEHADALLPWVTFLARSGRFDEAAAALKSIESQPPAITTRAWLAWMRGELPEALKLAKLTPEGDHRAQLTRATIYLDASQFESVKGVIKELTRAGHTHEAQVFTALSEAVARPQDALDPFKRLDALVETRSDALTLWANARARLLFMQHAPSVPDGPATLKRTVDLLKVATTQEPRDARLHFLLCDALNRSGKGDAALKSCEQGRKLNARWPAGIVTTAEVLGHVRAGDEGWKLLVEARKTHPNSTQLSLALARAATYRGALDTARAELERWQGGLALSAELQVLTLGGFVALYSGDRASARVKYERARDLDRTHPEVLILGGLAQMNHVEKLGAAEPLLKPVQEHPYWGALALSAMGDLKLLQKQPLVADELHARAVTVAAARGKSRALQTRLAINQIEVNHRLIKDWSASRIDRMGRQAEAIGGPTQPRLLFLKALDEQRRRRTQDEALAHLKQALTLDSKSCDAARAIVALATKLKHEEAALDAWTATAKACD